MEKYYCFAGVEIAVSIPDNLAYSEDRNLAGFAVEALEDPHRFRFDVVARLSPPVGSCIAREPAFWVYGDGQKTLRYIGSVGKGWENAYARVENRGKEHDVQLTASQYTERIGGKTVMNCLMAEHLLAQKNGVILHSSYIDQAGEGILFTAPSGTGKSTQAELWRAYRNAEVINGDRSALRVTQEGVFACGVPFAGSSQICKNRELPLKAIVYLKQSPETSIRRLRGAEAFRRVWEGCSVNVWDKDDVARVSRTVEQVVVSVPVYELVCTPDESAVNALEGALQL